MTFAAQILTLCKEIFPGSLGQSLAGKANRPGFGTRAKGGVKSGVLQ